MKRLFIFCAVIFVGLIVGGVFAATRPRALGIIVNHHLFAEKFIDAEFKKVSNQNPSVVVVISPNHFDRSFSKVLTTDRTWKTDFGEMVSANYLVPTIDVLDRPFDFEHGVSNIIPFVKKTFPSARVIPLMIKESMTPDEIDVVAREIDAALPSDALFVGSFDFSHMLPSEVAEFHDLMSFDSIVRRDYDSMQNLDIDSRAGLRLLVKLMEARGATSFIAGVQTNAARLVGRPWSSDNTSYITGSFWTATEEGQNEGVVTLLILPRGSLSRFELMPRLLYGQHITAVSGDKISDRDRMHAQKSGHTLKNDTWAEIPENTIRLITFRGGEVADERDIELLKQNSQFVWPEGDNSAILR